MEGQQQMQLSQVLHKIIDRLSHEPLTSILLTAVLAFGGYLVIAVVPELKTLVVESQKEIRQVSENSQRLAQEALKEQRLDYDKRSTEARKDYLDAVRTSNTASQKQIELLRDAINRLEAAMNKLGSIGDPNSSITRALRGIILSANLPPIGTPPPTIPEPTYAFSSIQDQVAVIATAIQQKDPCPCCKGKVCPECPCTATSCPCKASDCCEAPKSCRDQGACVGGCQRACQPLKPKQLEKAPPKATKGPRSLSRRKWVGRCRFVQRSYRQAPRRAR